MGPSVRGDRHVPLVCSHLFACVGTTTAQDGGGNAEPPSPRRLSPPREVPIYVRLMSRKYFFQWACNKINHTNLRKALINLFLVSMEVAQHNFGGVKGFPHRPLRCPRLSCMDTPFWRCDDYEDLRPCWWGPGEDLACALIPQMWPWAIVGPGPLFGRELGFRFFLRSVAPPSPCGGGGYPRPLGGWIKTRRVPAGPPRS